jgi:molybdenum cofactor cytidylyltransferase
MNNVSAIVLAAGTSSRMGAPNKLLLDFNGAPLVRHVVMRIVASSPFETIVVTGHQEEQVIQALAGLEVSFVHNSRFEEGMTSSIQAGVAVARGEGFMICLSDMYAMSAARYQELMEFFQEKLVDDKMTICLPFHDGKRGNPVIFSAGYRHEILSHPDPEGCRKIVQENSVHLQKLQTASSEILQDLDTPQDYQQARNNVGKTD